MRNHKINNSDETKFIGKYRAVVVDNEDEFQAGRVKIRVYGIHDNVVDEALPWAIRQDPLMGNSIIIPDVDTEVWVFFEGGDHDLPVYEGAAPARPTTPEEVLENYPNRKVIKTKAGFVIQIDDTEGNTSLTITQPNTNERHVDHDGNDTNTIVGDLIINVESGKVLLNSDDIRLGDDSDLETAVLGEQLAAWANEIVDYINGHTHIGNQGSKTSVPVSPFNIGTADEGGAVYSTKVKIQP